MNSCNHKQHYKNKEKEEDEENLKAATTTTLPTTTTSSKLVISSVLLFFLLFFFYKKTAFFPSFSLVSRFVFLSLFFVFCFLDNLKSHFVTLSTSLVTYALFSLNEVCFLVSTCKSRLLLKPLALNFCPD